MTVRLGVVAHTSRAEQAHALGEQIGAVYTSIDDGSLGCWGNHRKVWNWLTDHPGDAEWIGVIEDDAVAVDDFQEQLALALAASPCDVVSLYMGTGYPASGWQDRIRDAIDRDPDTHWFTANKTLHAVGLCVRTRLLPMQLVPDADWLAATPTEIDRAIAGWCIRNHHEVAYAWPSLVDHHDGPTLVDTPHPNMRQQLPRKAWRAGTRRHWTSASAPLSPSDKGISDVAV